MAFTDAIFDGCATLDGVDAQLVEKHSLLRALLVVHEILPVTTINFAILIKTLRPNVLVDARMRKHSQPEMQIHLARLTIGLGPNFIAGKNVHLAVETSRGESLGQAIAQGSTKPLSGEPNSITGHARDRYVYAPAAGIFRSFHEIGDIVGQGQEVARIGEIVLTAPISGVLRGLTRDGVKVEYKTKVIEIDPRTETPQISGIAERPARIAHSILQIVQDWEQNHAH